MSFFGGAVFGGGFFGAIGGGGARIGNVQSWQDHVKAMHEKRMLETEVRVQVKELKKVEKKIQVVRKEAVKASAPQGVLANLAQLEVKRDAIEQKIEAARFDLRPLIAFLAKKEIDEDDEDFFTLQ